MEKPRATQHHGGDKDDPCSGAVSGGGSVLRSEVVSKWIRTIARRELTEGEWRALSLGHYFGAPGAAEMSSRGLAVAPQRGELFEAVIWDATVHDLDVRALLCTPSQMEFTPVEEPSPVVLVLQVLSGVLLLAHRQSTEVLGTGQVTVVHPAPHLLFQTRGVFSAICVHLPLEPKSEFEDPPVSRETTRLRAAVELGKACLVEQLNRQVQIDKNARILRELLVVDQVPRDTGSFADNGELLRKQVLSLIEWEHTDPHFTVQRIISHLGISRRHLYRSFSGREESVAALILNRRLETSIQYLKREPRMSIEEVAARSGFSSSDQYRRAFRRVYGMTPLRYRNTHCRDEGNGIPTI